MITFRRFEPTDRELIKDWFGNDPVGMKFLPSYRTIDDYAHLIDFKKRYLFIALQNEVAIGFLDFEIENPEVGYIAFFIAPTFRNQGIGFELLRKTFELLEVKQVKMLEAGVEKDNAISIKLLEKAGFSYAYTDKDDMFMYQRRL